MSPSVLETGAPPETLRVLIVDDEPLARDCMRLALQRATDVTIVAECSDGIGAVDAIRAHAPDVVFLDVQMPGLDGFGVIDQVGTDAMPVVVFVTAFDAHAIRAFEVHALDYVLKPFDDQRFLAALEHARAALRERHHGELGRRLAQVVRSWYLAPRDGVRDQGGEGHVIGDDVDTSEPVRRATSITRFAVRKDGRVRFIGAAAVDWIEADGNYMVLHVGDAEHRIRASLRQVIEELDPRLFVRIHRSVIVNVERIREVQPWFGGDYVAILRNGTKLKVSRLRAGKLLKPMA
jgi:two-component system LytT family response regulator